MKSPQQKLSCCVALLLALTACNREPVTTTETPLAAGTLQPRLNSLAGAVANAEALRDVKRLQWAYGHYSELGLWYDFADLFADTGIGHYVQGDLNRDQIRALFYDQVGQGKLGLATGRIYPHISFSPVVDLEEDGLHARGRFRILAMLGGYGGNATWFHGLYENAYVSEAGVWKLNELSNTAQISGNPTNGLTASSKAPLDKPTFPIHFSSDVVGRTPFTALSDGAGDPSVAFASLQQRLERLNDEAAISNLQHQYGYYFDEHNWNALVELFADDGSFESDRRGVYIGKTSIRNALNQFGPEGQTDGVIDEHLMFQTYVSIAPDGQSAKTRVDQLGMQGKPGESAQWTQGIYENTFVKQDGEWRIQSVHYYPRLITDYAKLWNNDAQPAPGPSSEYPPDAPATENYAIFPEFYIPAFSFPHPVTGRPPQYPEADPAIGKPIGFDIPVRLDEAAAANAAAGATLLPTQLDTAEEQAQRALGYDAVENLINAYAYYLDECMPEQAAALFTDNGLNEIPGIGYYAGPGHIANALQIAYCPNGRQENELTIHHALQPVITVADDGQRATVVSRLWQIHVGGEQEDYYLMGRFEGEAIKDNDQWKLASLSTHYNWVAPISEGWAQATQNETLGYAAPQQMKDELPPDRPSTSSRLAPYP